MRRRICAGLIVGGAGLGLLLGSGEARAQGYGWGLHSGETLHGRDNMVYGEVGWPDFSMGFQHGMSDKVDVGVRLSIDYGPLYSLGTGIGMGLRAPIRLSLTKGRKVSAFFHIQPGVKFAAFNPVLFGLQFPLGVEVGIHLTKEATLQFGGDVPFYLNLTNGVFVNVPILLGPGFDYHIDDHMALGLNMRFGPNIYGGGGRGGYYGYGYGRGYYGGRGGAGVVLGLIAQVYFAYRL